MTLNKRTVSVSATAQIAVHFTRETKWITYNAEIEKAKVMEEMIAQLQQLLEVLKCQTRY